MVYFDPLIVTFQGQTLFWSSMLPKAPLISQKITDSEKSPGGVLTGETDGDAST